MKTLNNALIALICGLALAACGGGGGGEGSGGGYAGTGKLTLSITDAPVDGAKEVWITIDGILIKRSEGDGNEKRISLDVPDTVPNVASDAWEITPEGYLKVNLLQLNGGSTLPLFNNETVTSGNYQWVRFNLVKNGAYIVWEDTNRADSPLQLPADKNELKTSGGFSVGSGDSVAYIMDWDLRKSIVERSSGYLLKPVIHIKRDDEFAHVTGQVSDSLFNTCAPEDVPMVYVFNGTDVTPNDMSSAVFPTITVPVSPDPNQSFYIGPVDADNYTIAFLCNGQDDDPEVDDNLVFPTEGTINITLQVGENTGFTL